MKFFLLAVCFVTVLTADGGTTSGNVGYSLLGEWRFVKPAGDSWLKPELKYSGKAIITGIIIDDNLNGKGANYTVVSGGVGFNSTKIILKETGAEGIDSIIYILGKEIYKFWLHRNK